MDRRGGRDALRRHDRPAHRARGAGLPGAAFEARAGRRHPDALPRAPAGRARLARLPGPPGRRRHAGAAAGAAPSLGLCTGNLALGARLKLRHAGLDGFFDWSPGGIARLRRGRRGAVPAGPGGLGQGVDGLARRRSRRGAHRRRHPARRVGRSRRSACRCSASRPATTRRRSAGSRRRRRARQLEGAAPGLLAWIQGGPPPGAPPGRRRRDGVPHAPARGTSRRAGDVDALQARLDGSPDYHRDVEGAPAGQDAAAHLLADAEADPDCGGSPLWPPCGAPAAGVARPVAQPAGAWNGPRKAPAGARVAAGPGAGARGSRPDWRRRWATTGAGAAAVGDRRERRVVGLLEAGRLRPGERLGAGVTVYENRGVFSRPAD